MEVLDSPVRRKGQQLRFLAFGLGSWILGLVLATFFGLGWFFLVQAMRRVAISIPSVRDRLSKFVLGEQAGELSTSAGEDAKRRRRVSTGLQIAISVAWVALTIIVFAKFNFRLFDLFQ